MTYIQATDDARVKCCVVPCVGPLGNGIAVPAVAVNVISAELAEPRFRQAHDDVLRNVGLVVLETSLSDVFRGAFTEWEARLNPAACTGEVVDPVSEREVFTGLTFTAEWVAMVRARHDLIALFYIASVHHSECRGPVIVDMARSLWRGALYGGILKTHWVSKV